MDARTTLDGTPAPSADGGPPGGGVWRAPLRERLRARPLPLVWTRDALVPGATLWAGARRWTAWLRAHGVGPGDRVVCALPPGPGFVMLLVAALWDELTFVPVLAPRPEDLSPAVCGEVLAAVDARLAVAVPGTPAGCGVVAADRAGTPPDGTVALRPRAGAASPAVRLLLQTSGTTGAPRRVALSDANLWAVLDSHWPALALADATVLSVLPWHHAFGLVMELLPALLAGAELVRDASGGRDLDALLALAREHPVTHLSLVPHTARRLAAAPEGLALLGALRGGVVGGAPVDGELAAVLAGTWLRAGYGQTEASPGITLGESGAWRAGALGRPLGCEVRLDVDGVLAFRGPNACLGEWRPGDDGRGALHTLPPDRWVRTGDLARHEADGTYTFAGRVADRFKLDTGRFADAPGVEGAVRARWPHVTDALLSSPDGLGLVLAVSTRDGADPALAPDALAGALGPLAGRPLRVVLVPPDGWVRTPKGELDRRFPTGRAG